MTNGAGDTSGGVGAALMRFYGDREPDFRWVTKHRWAEGGPDPLDEVLVYARDLPVPHWHYVSVGLTHGITGTRAGEPDIRSSALGDDGGDGRGWTFELTARLVRVGDREHVHPPVFMANVLQNLARYVVESGNALGPGHTMDLYGPIQLGSDTPVTQVLLVEDPDLSSEVEGPPKDSSSIDFLQLVGLTADEVAAKKSWRLDGFAALFAERYPLLVTHLDRASILEEPAVREAVAAGRAQDGSSTAAMVVGDLGVASPTRMRSRLGHAATIAIEASAVEAFCLQLPLRIAFGRPFTIESSDLAVTFIPDEAVQLHQHEPGRWLIGLSRAQAEAVARTVAPVAGTYAVDGLPRVRFEVRRTHVRDQHGETIATIG